MIRYPTDLPICTRREDILAALRSHQVLVVAGETGSGKTTQLPKMCLEAGLAANGRKIGCTQPRRVAAMSISRRVAEELGVTWGREVGCKMRFQDDTARDTQIKFMTDGILLAEIQSDPALRAYSALILDEAHERSLNIDFLLGHLQGLLQKRPDLKLLITSATIDTEAFSKAFGGAPIIEVSGRLWPVEIRYAPVENLADTTDEGGETTHIEAAVRATEEALVESDAGDVLIFMPTERDIRDTRDLLETSLGKGTEVLCLFGRMPAADQQRIFQPGPLRRVIVATNIAETSITLPRIRYVIDSGLTRLSRYNPRTRTRRLPVEPISQSSANQRAGRAGRLQDGICIRLYDEEDYLKRPRFTQPEIQRSNLAEVILRMKAFRLGEIETFPFLNPPALASMRAGYRLLHELSAIDDTHELTPMGHQLARLPLDPTLGRMLLQARRENALEEVLVIAAGLSIPDPRERPEDARDAADAAHRAFAHPESDFLSLLNIWDAAPPEQGRSSTNALRRFCRKNFLSFTRMREWRDLQRQLAEAMDTRPAEPDSQRKLDPKALHRCVLTGLLSQIALRQERNTFKATAERVVTMFPGSHLYERREKSTKARPPASTGPREQPARWIMAWEIVETSQLFARMAAKIDPEWVVELGAHLCSLRHTEPHWSSKAGRVLVLERVLMGGLELARRHVDFGRIDPAKATEIFIRCALIEEQVRLPHRFFAENRKLRDKIETALTRVRSQRVLDVAEALQRFYAARIENVSSIHDLNRLVRDHITRTPDFLCATEADLASADAPAVDHALFPDQVKLGNSVLPIAYSYTPGQEDDGVTVRVPLPVAEQLTTGQLQWMVPGLREELIAVLLRALPKTIRKTLMPLEPKVREITSTFDPGRNDFLGALAHFISQKYRVPLSAADWPPQSLPAHLQPRVEVLDARSRTVASGRNLTALKAVVEAADLRSDAWNKAARTWERTGLTQWSFGDLPESLVVEEVAAAPLLAFPGLAERDGAVDVRLFRKREEADQSTRTALRCLGRIALGRDLEKLSRDVRNLGHSAPAKPAGTGGFRAALDKIGAQVQPGSPASPDLLQETACQHLLHHVMVLHPLLPLTASRFETLLTSARGELPKLAYALAQWTRQILELRTKVLASTARYPSMEADVQRLVPPDFLARTPHTQLPHLHRYLRAIQLRADRAALSPAKDAEKAARLAPFSGWETRVPTARHDEFRWMLEEFRVSVFAQDLGTAHPVSELRLKALGTW